MENVSRCIVKYLITWFMIVVVGVCLLTLVNLLPEYKIKNHIQESFNYMQIEKDYPFLGISSSAYSKDNWTEAVLLNFMYNSKKSTPLYSALIEQEYRPDVGLTGVERLEKLLLNEGQINESDIIERSSYWLGYKIFLRPLLYISDYYTIIMLLNIISMLILMGCVLYIAKKMDYYVAFGFAGIMILFNYHVMSMQLTIGIFCIYVAYGAIFTILKREIVDIVYFMFVVGIMTSFFDWFSIPLITFGLPMCFYIKKNVKKEKAFIWEIKELLKGGIGWCLGYGTMVITKTGVAAIVIGKNSLLLFNERINADVSKSTITVKEWGGAIQRLVGCVFPFNLINSSTQWIFVIGGIILLVILLLFFINGKSEVLIYMIIALAPMAWYIVFRGHIHHVLIDYRTLMISYFSIWMGLQPLCESLKHNV